MGKRCGPKNSLTVLLSECAEIIMSGMATEMAAGSGSVSLMTNN